MVSVPIRSPKLESQMSTRQLKTGYFVIEGLNSFATVLYSYYFYFFMQARFGFGNEANLVLAALNGFAYMLGSWWGGRFAQRHGYFLSLKLGFTMMALALAIGCWVQSSGGQIIVMLTVVLGMCLTWPTLEALVSENETRANLQRLVGLYNVIWAGTGALAYFIGGALLDHLGLQTLFLVPIVVLAGQLALTFWLELAAKSSPPPTPTALPETHNEADAIPHAPAEAKMFLRMAWLSNPFAYIAINTLLAVIPGVAQRLGLSTTLAGFCCSVWCFARVGAFIGLWFWPGWHYRFRWLLVSFVILIVTFAVILTVSNLAGVVVAQLLFGGAIGLIYYSSLFYSMDVGETKGEHGGIHEAAIGLGNFAGPAVGAASLHFLPQYGNSGAIAVSALLVCGLGGLVAIRYRTRA
jgi:predicted MFS family arabinose efflux permease